MTPKPKRRKAARARRPENLNLEEGFNVGAYIDGDEDYNYVAIIENDHDDPLYLTEKDVARLAPFFAQADAYFKARKGKR